MSDSKHFVFWFCGLLETRYFGQMPKYDEALEDSLAILVASRMKGVQESIVNGGIESEDTEEGEAILFVGWLEAAIEYNVSVKKIAQRLYEYCAELLDYETREAVRKLSEGARS